MISDLFIRLVRLDDAQELCGLLNEIIEIGGTTAYETPLTEDEFRNGFLLGERHLCCYVAIDFLGALAGFQVIERHPELPDDWVDIATFARVAPRIKGIGTALFAKTIGHAREAGVTAINATIRADNKGGLTYYERIGFRTYSVAKDIPLNNGKKIDRISKRLFIS